MARGWDGNCSATCNISLKIALRITFTEFACLTVKIIHDGVAALERLRKIVVFDTEQNL